jgi:hypothetical protein
MIMDAHSNAIVTVKPDGTRIARYPDGKTVTVPVNSDVCEMIESGTGQKIIRYWNGKVETEFLNGTRVTSLIDGTEVIEFSNGDKTTRLPDKTTIYEYVGGGSITARSDGSVDADEKLRSLAS